MIEQIMQQWTTYLGAIVLSWVASVIAFPAIPFQQWLNSKFRFLWRIITFLYRGRSYLKQ